MGHNILWATYLNNWSTHIYELNEWDHVYHPLWKKIIVNKPTCKYKTHDFDFILDDDDDDGDGDDNDYNTGNSLSNS